MSTLDIFETQDPVIEGELELLCNGIVRALRNTRKPGGQDLSNMVEQVKARLAENTSAESGNSIADSNIAIERLRNVYATVQYWTDRDAAATARRRRDRMLGRCSHMDLLRCCGEVSSLIPNRDQTHEMASSSHEPLAQPHIRSATTSSDNSGQRPRISHPPGSEGSSSLNGTHAVVQAVQIAPHRASRRITNDVFLAGLRRCLETTSGIADLIPDPAGTIVKAITNTGVEVIDLLDDVDSNKDEAKKLAAHINSLVQAVVQYLPHRADTGRTTREEMLDMELERTLTNFSTVLNDVSTGLRDLRAQGRFSQMALHEQNKSSLEGFDKDIERAFRTLQVQLNLKMLRCVYGLAAADNGPSRQSLLDRLGAADNGAQEKAADERDLLCLPGTRTDVLRQISAWIRDPSAGHIMWLNAVAGCGKTAIAATIHNQQKALYAVTAIFYFTAGNQARCTTVIRCLALWLARSSHGSLEKSIREAIRDEPDIATLPLSAQVDLLLAKPLASISPDAPPLVLVLDALDEWYDTGKVSALVTLLVNLNVHPNVKILITSRDERRIADPFAISDRARVRTLQLDAVEARIVEKDIEVYLKSQFEKLYQQNGLDPDWPGPRRLRALVLKSEQLFQYAATAVLFIKSGYPPDTLDELLDSPTTSTTLKDLYLTILRRIFPGSSAASTNAVLKHVLTCLVCSPVPVSLDVIAFLWKDSAVEHTRIRRSALDHLGSFLVVPGESEFHVPIRFLHTTIVDFLTDPEQCTDPRFVVNLNDGNAYLAKLCLERLTGNLRQNICHLEDMHCGIDGSGPGSCSIPSDHISNVISTAISPGLKHVSLHWEKHLSAIPSAMASDALIAAVYAFASAHLLHWIETLAFLKSVLSVGYHAARTAAEWFSTLATSGGMAQNSTSLLHDASRFMALFSEVLSSHPLTCYEYLLSFIPPESMLRRHYGRISNAVRVIRGPISWPAYRWSAAHGAWVHCIAISPDGMTIASSGTNRVIKLWDTASGMPKGSPLVGHLCAVDSLAFTPDGKTLVSRSEDLTIRLWNMELGQQEGAAFTRYELLGWCVAISPDGTVLAAGSGGGTVRLLSVEDGRPIIEPLVAAGGAAYSAAFSPHGSMLVCGYADGSVQRWNPETGGKIGYVLAGHSERVFSVAVSPDGMTIASASMDKSIQLWDAHTGCQLCAPLTNHSDAVWSVAFSPDSASLVSGSADGTVRLWDARTGEPKGKPLQGHFHHVMGVAFTPNGTAVVSGSLDGTVRAWDVEALVDAGEQDMSSPKPPYTVTISSNGKLVASGYRNESPIIMVWSAETGSLVGRVETGYGGGELKFFMDGSVLREEGGRLWDNVVREWLVSAPVDGLGYGISSLEPHITREGTDHRVERLEIDEQGWIQRGGRKWLWLPLVYGRPFRLQSGFRCFLFQSTLIVEKRDVYILDVSAIL